MELYKVTLGGESETKMKSYLRDNILSLRDGLRELHEVKLPNWRKRYEAVPYEKSRTFPFENASNIVIPIVAIHTDTLLARIMAGVFKLRPMWPINVVGEYLTDMEPLRQGLEDFLQFMALEQEQWDLYRVYREWWAEAIKYGTSTIKSPWLTETIETLVPGDGTGKYDFVTEVRYDGSRPEKMPFEDFWVPPAVKSVESATFKCHRRRLLKEELMERRFKQIFDPAKVDLILKSPDRTSPLNVQQQKEQDTGAKTVSSYGYAEWDIYECWCTLRVTPKTRTKIIVWYHLSTNTILRAIYDTYPTDSFVTARLFYRDDAFYGMGFCEEGILGMFQEEISQAHNQRRDAMTVANSKAWRVAPNSKLHSGYKIYPSAMLPAEKDEIEPLAMGEPGEMSIEDERLSLELAERRSGVAPPMQGAGAGAFNKRGIYSATGTLSVMQDQNTRTDLNISDMRYAHLKVGRMLAKQQARFGLDAHVIDTFGKKAESIRQALRAFENDGLALSITSPSASLNREVEKQSDIMLNGIVARHYQMITQILGSLQSQMTPPAVREYGTQVIRSANRLMRMVLRHFNYDEPERFIPDAPEGDVAQGGQGANSGVQRASQGGGQVSEMVGPGGGGAFPSMVPSGSRLLQ